MYLPAMYNNHSDTCKQKQVIKKDPPPYNAVHHTQSYMQHNTKGLSPEYRLLLASFVSESFLVTQDKTNNQYIVSYGTRATGTNTEIPFTKYKNTVQYAYNTAQMKRNSMHSNDPELILYNHYNYVNQAWPSTNKKMFYSKSLLQAFEHGNMISLCILTQERQHTLAGISAHEKKENTYIQNSNRS
jgi:hypothetical protein